MIDYKWEEQKDDSIAIDLGKIIVDKEDLQKVLTKRWDIRVFSSIGRSTTLIISKFVFGETKKGFVIDHIDGDSLNNRRSNLREVTRQQNIFNKSPDKKSTSKYKGVCRTPNKEKWFAQIRANSCFERLGIFKKETDAAKAYDEAAKKYFGEYAYLNFPSPGTKRYKQKLDYFENEDGSFSVDFGKLIIDKENLDEFLKRKWRINISTSHEGKFIKIYDLVYGPKKEKKNIIDHINCDIFDNRKANLRECTPQQNQFNKRGNFNSSSKYKGVSWNTKNKRWMSKIKLNDRNIHIGSFKDEILAARSYDVLARYLFKEHARLNFPDMEPLELNIEKILNRTTQPKNKYFGVTFITRQNKYRASIRINKKQIWLGQFKTAIEAAKRYNEEAIKYGIKKLNVIPITE